MGKKIKISDIKFNPFVEDELKSLQLFHEQFKKMLDCQIIKDKALKFNVSFKVTATGSLKTEADAPADDQLGLLLMRIRPCLLERDKIFFNRIKNILTKNAANQETREYFETFHKDYQSFLKTSPVDFHIDGKKYWELDIFNAFLNGEYFHIRDEEPQEIVRLFKKKHLICLKVR